MSLPEQQDLEGNLQNLTLNPPPPTDQPGSSAPPQEEELDLEEQLHPSLERYRKLRDQFCDDFYGWTTTIWENASTPIRPYARDFLLDNGVTLDPNMRKIGDKLVAL
ncbi:hypothetical protein E4U45_006494 [Claviceps purpurea]|nr:hypothetical protein E4U45_006494 [Claviceps purpurea]